MNTVSEKLARLLVSMGLTPRSTNIASEREGWELVFALRHPEIWARRQHRDPDTAAKLRHRKRPTHRDQLEHSGDRSSARR